MQLITKEQSKNINEGIEVYQKNDVFKSLANVMEHPEFKSFFDKYFENPTEAQTMLMFMKICQKITENDPDASPYEKLALVNKIMKDREFRPVVVGKFLDWFGRVSDSKSTNHLVASDCSHLLE